MQTALSFPASLTEKYRPRKVAEFAGLEKQKHVFRKLIDARSLSGHAFLFVGPSGTGKTSLALAICSESASELHHIGSQECKVEELDYVFGMCQYVPYGGGAHCILVDEADQMSSAAQLKLLSRLDATKWPPNTFFIFTCNATDRLESRFLSRCMTLEFSTYGTSAEVQDLLSRVWDEEAHGVPKPNFARIVKDACNNVRESLMKVELELLQA
jgi:replication-associated recombination protein RarA